MVAPPRHARFARYRKRIPVTFGLHADHQETAGFTTNLSGTGFGLQANSVQGPGTLMFGTFHLPDGAQAAFEAQVAWSRHPEKAMGLSGAMGVRLRTADEAYFHYVLATSKSPGNVGG